ncbi:MAG: DUF2158 domain-containing protein, partial [Candidatus Brocadiales bacterium]|nr:DUF2158 domain-containing protein [Candidatus Bathyanammoxibius sp.]
MDDESTKFPVGAVVRLKSGGPAMTVAEVNSHEGRRVCHWHYMRNAIPET